MTVQKCIRRLIIHSRDSLKNADSSSEVLNHSFKPMFHNLNIINWCIKYIFFKNYFNN